MALSGIHESLSSWILRIGSWCVCAPGIDLDRNLASEIDRAQCRCKVSGDVRSNTGRLMNESLSTNRPLGRPRSLAQLSNPVEAALRLRSPPQNGYCVDWPRGASSGRLWLREKGRVAVEWWAVPPQRKGSIAQLLDRSLDRSYPNRFPHNVVKPCDFGIEERGTKRHLKLGTRLCSAEHHYCRTVYLIPSASATTWSQTAAS